MMDVAGVGRFSVWDYAGQPEYYVTHELFLVDEEALFVVVCSLADASESRKQHVMYWLRFIKTRFEDKNAKPTVILVGSNRDRAIEKNDLTTSLGVWSSRWGCGLVQEANGMFGNCMRIVNEFVVLDCRKSQELNKFKEVLKTSFQQTAQKAKQVPRLCEHIIAHTLPNIRTSHSLLLRSELESRIVVDNPFVKGKAEVIDAITGYLRDIGEIVWFDGLDLVIVDVPWLCTDIIGPLLAPNNFVIPRLSATSTDKVTTQQLQLVYRQFQVAKAKTAKISTNTPRSTTRNQWFENEKELHKVVELLENLGLCFETAIPHEWIVPALLDCVPPTSPWQADSTTFTRFVGRRVSVQQPNIEMFSAGFFPRLQVRCAAVFCGNVTLWKGVLVGVRDEGVQCCAVLREGGVAVDVMLRAADSLEALTCMGSVLQQVMEMIEMCRQQSCNGSQVKVQALSVKDMKQCVEEPARFNFENLQQLVKAGQQHKLARPEEPRGSMLMENVLELLGPEGGRSQKDLIVVFHHTQDVQAALTIRQHLESHGLRVKTSGQSATQQERLALVDEAGVIVVCLSQVFCDESDSNTLCERMIAQQGHLSVVVAKLDAQTDPQGPVALLVAGKLYVKCIALTQTNSNLDCLQQLQQRVQDAIPTAAVSSTHGQGKWVMLSYQWASHKLVQYVNAKLKQEGFVTWVDFERMSAYNSVPQGMAKAVEGSAVVVLFLTKKYQDSKNCTYEYLYTNDKGKQVVVVKAEESFVASDSLGLLTAGKLWIKGCDESKWDEVIQELVQRLKTLNVPKC
eukprot:c13196_g1_i1.p1 GENE.c13196_g1_i1~~c13196_g1_i1.p1  ORF type:complete len:793 (+),score=244.08 c13196_g1_i1:900-3278(+)